MKQVSNSPPERPRLRDSREQREPNMTAMVPLEQGRLFAHLLADDSGEGSYGASRVDVRALVGAAGVEALVEQLVPRIQMSPQWPLQAVLYLPRLGRINATVRREQGAWSIDLEADDAATGRWLTGVRQQCQDRVAGALGQPVRLNLPKVDVA